MPRRRFSGCAAGLERRRVGHEVVRLEAVASGDRKARRVKDEQEDERWQLLNESLRLQNQTVELASEERLLVAQGLRTDVMNGVEYWIGRFVARCLVVAAAPPNN